MAVWNNFFFLVFPRNGLWASWFRKRGFFGGNKNKTHQKKNRGAFSTTTLVPFFVFRGKHKNTSWWWLIPVLCLELLCFAMEICHTYQCFSPWELRIRGPKFPLVDQLPQVGQRNNACRFENLNDRCMTEKLKPFDSFRWDFSYAFFPLQLLQVFVFEQKRRQQKKTLPTDPKNNPQHSQPRNGGKMHAEVKREYAADEKMASSQPWQLRWAGISCLFGSPKACLKIPPLTYHPQKQGLKFKTLLRETSGYRSNICCVLVVWKTWGWILFPPVKKYEMCFWEQINK